MKSIFTFALTAFSAFAAAPASHAAPAVGDTAVFEAVVENGAEKIIYSLTQEYASIDSEGKITVKQTLSHGGTVLSEDNTETTVEEVNQVEYIVDHCQEIADAGLPQGTTLKSESITVPAGTFNSCHLVSPQQDIHLGKVPTGTIKAIGTLTNGSKMTMTLQSYIKK